MTKASYLSSGRSSRQHLWLPLFCLMSNAPQDILSYPNQVPLIPACVHWFPSSYQNLQRLKSCSHMWWRELGEKNNTTSFKLVGHLWILTGAHRQEHRQKRQPHHHSAHHICKSKFSQTWSVMMTLCQLRCDHWPNRELSALVRLTHISSWGLTQ